jgi:hypothetical protein
MSAATPRRRTPELRYHRIVTPPFPPPAPRAFRLGALDAGTAFLLLFGGIWGLIGTILAIVLSLSELASAIGLMILLPLGFAVVGALLFALGGRRALRLRAIYVSGQAALATVTGIASSLMRVNGRRVMRVEYAFDTPSGRVQGRTTLREPPPIGGTLWVIYDERAPGRNVAA